MDWKKGVKIVALVSSIMIPGGQTPGVATALNPRIPPKDKIGKIILKEPLPNPSFRLPEYCPENYKSADYSYTKIDYANPKVRKDLQQGKYGCPFLSALEKICEEVDMNCMALLSIINHETEGTFRPDLHNPYGSAVGLLQFIEASAQRLGTTTLALSRMGQIEQLEFVKKYFYRRYGHLIEK